jgi:hypothetical protein
MSRNKFRFTHVGKFLTCHESWTATVIAFRSVANILTRVFQDRKEVGNI